MSRFRSSHALAAVSNANFGIKGTLANSMILVPPLNPKFANALCGTMCANFGFAALADPCDPAPTLRSAGAARGANDMCRVGLRVRRSWQLLRWTALVALASALPAAAQTSVDLQLVLAVASIYRDVESLKAEATMEQGAQVR